VNQPVQASDDLSGSSDKATDAANAILLGDSRARRTYRTVAVASVAVVLLCLLYALYRIVCALVLDLAFVSGPAVGVAATLVVAIAVLAIALLRSTFAPTTPSEKNEDGPIVTTTALEALKELKDAAEVAIKAFTPKGGG
jgi:hypothetical protein